MAQHVDGVMPSSHAPTRRGIEGVVGDEQILRMRIGTAMGIDIVLYSTGQPGPIVRRSPGRTLPVLYGRSGESSRRGRSSRRPRILTLVSFAPAFQFTLTCNGNLQLNTRCPLPAA